MFVGAVIVGILTALFTEWIRRFGRVDEGASMGVVFTSLFALGLVMIVQAADHVDLDAGCVLFGSIELTPLDTVMLGQFEIPRATLVLGSVALLNGLFVLLFFKELKLSSFDPSLATTTGFNASLMHYLLMILVAVTAVASFESVGNILVVAMFVVPPAAAYLLTDRLGWMILIGIGLAAFSAIAGHIAALEVPGWFGYRSTTTAGMMAVVAGLVLLSCALLGPRYGIATRLARRRLLTHRILADDIVAFLYRLKEREDVHAAPRKTLQTTLFANRFSLWLAANWLKNRQQIEMEGEMLRLTPQGEETARQLVRSHRLWEQYLASHASVEATRLHDKAERFEHFTDRILRDELDAATGAPSIDPHGSPIPDEQSESS